MEQDKKEQENKKDEFLGVTLATSEQKSVPVVISEKWEKEREIDQTFVTFQLPISGLRVLGKMSDIKTQNPFMDPKNIGGKNLVYLKHKGEVPNLSESTDAKLATVDVVGCKSDAKERIQILFNSPNTGLKVFSAKDDDFKFFFESEFDDPIKFAKIRGSSYILPMEPTKFFLHTDIIADTGKGKSHLASLLTAELQGKTIKLQNKDKQTENKKIGVWVIDRDGQFANDAFGVFEKYKTNKIIVKYEEMRVENRKELVALVEREYDFKYLPFKAKLEEVNSWLLMNLEEPYTYEGFCESLKQSIEKAYRNKKNAETIIQDTIDALQLKKAENTWKDKILKKLKAPYGFNELIAKSGEGNMVILNLENAEEFQKPIIAEFLLKKLFEKAKEEYESNQLEYGFSTLVFIDEIQDYCPEGFDDKWYNKDSKEIIIKIAKQGRKYGLGLILASQRYTSVAKDALTQMNNHFIANVKFGDRARVKDEHGDDILKAITSLGPHEFVCIGEVCPTKFAVVKGVFKDG